MIIAGIIERKKYLEPYPVSPTPHISLGNKGGLKGYVVMSNLKG